MAKKNTSNDSIHMEDQLITNVDQLIEQDAEETGPTPVALPSGKGTVYVRALSRKEVLRVKIRPGKTVPLDVWERRILALAMVSPAMTQAQVEQWQNKRGAVGDINAVLDTVSRISGMRQETPKSNLSPVREESRD